MAKRRRVGLIYSYDESWIAGTYYILNIVNALNVIENNLKPRLLIFTEDKNHFNSLKAQTKYPFLTFVKFPKKQIPLLSRIINKASRIIFGKNILYNKPLYPNVDMMYPNYIQDVKGLDRKVNWYPDFQERYLPDFFSNDEIKRRKDIQDNQLAKGDIAVFSSDDAKKDFLKFCPDAKAKPFVLNFAVSHPDFSSIDINALERKYNFSGDYFFLPNQFWVHKNHMTAFQAIRILKDSGIKILLLLSGKESDYRATDNIEKLKLYVEEHDLSNHIKFLGFLPRKEQLCLFNNAKAIIQPSLFEGWSTVIEDAKALNKFVIASDLPVHREQIHTNIFFFKPDDAQDLAKVIRHFQDQEFVEDTLDYQKNINEFAYKFLSLINA